MWFDTKSEKSNLDTRPRSTCATCATNRTHGGKDGPHVAHSPALKSEKPERAVSPPEVDRNGLPNVSADRTPEKPDYPHGTAINGHPKTATGKIVSPDDWDALSEWDKHGPNGRMFNALTQRWEFPEDIAGPLRGQIMLLLTDNERAGVKARAAAALEAEVAAEHRAHEEHDRAEDQYFRATRF